MEDALKKYLMEKYGMQQPDDQPTYMDTQDDADARIQAGMDSSAQQATSNAATDQLLTQEEDKLSGADQVPSNPDLQEEPVAPPTQQFPDARPVADILQNGISDTGQNMGGEHAPVNNLMPGEQAGIPDQQQALDVPHEQAQAQLKSSEIPLPDKGDPSHVGDKLKADDNQLKEKAVADEKLKETDPREYLMKKYGIGGDLGIDELKKAQAQADTGRFMANLGSGLLESGYLMKNMQMPEAQRAFYENAKKEAEIPVQRVEEKRKLLEQNLGMAQKTLDLATKDLDHVRTQRLTDANSNESKAIRSIVARAFKDSMPELTNDPSFNSLSGQDVKDYVSHFAEVQSRLEAAKNQREYNQEFKKQGQEDRRKNFNRTEQDKISKELNGLSQNSRSAIGLAGRNLIAADRALDVLNMGTVTPQDLSSVSADISNIISGTATVSGTKHQEYNTLQQQFQNLVQKITSNPKDAGVPELKSHLKDVIARMRKVSEDTIGKNLGLVKAGHPDFLAENPKYFDDYAKEQAGAFESPAGAEKPGEKSIGGVETVTVKRKSDGVTKTLPADKAAKYLNDPAFEKVQ